jgi:K+-sensing histidine kinase KdpD
MSDITPTAQAAAASPIKFDTHLGDRFGEELSHLPLGARYAVSLAMVALVTGLALAVEPLVAGPSLTLFFVAPVVLAATLFGWGPSMLAVAAGVLAYDFFFTEPKYSLEIASSTDIWAAALLLVTAAIVSAVAAQARGRAADARREAIRAEALRALAHMIVEGRSAAEIIPAAASTLTLIFQAPAVVFAEVDGHMAPVALSGGAEVTPVEETAALEAARSQVAVRGEVYPFPHSVLDLWPLVTRSGQSCVLGVDFKHAGGRRPRSPERFVELIAAYVAAAGD